MVHTSIFICSPHLPHIPFPSSPPPHSDATMTTTASSCKTPVFLLKTKSSPHDGYEEYFSVSGRYDPIFVPVLEHRFHDANLRTVRDLFISGAVGREYGGLIFTSQRAVEGFA